MDFNRYLGDILPGEVVVRVIRRDIIILINKIFWFFLSVALIGGGFGLILWVNPDISQSQFYPLLLLSVFSLAAFAWLFLFFSIVDYMLDLWFITDKRIIDIQQEGFFSRKVSEQYLDRVQDVSSEVSGIIPTIFRYGSVKVQTAGEHPQFIFEDVPNPEEIRRLIMSSVQKMQKSQTNEVSAQK
jgi:uncharacterized membrane protein YdbT with pleckstrin-like domain